MVLPPKVHQRPSVVRGDLGPVSRSPERNPSSAVEATIVPDDGRAHPTVGISGLLGPRRLNWMDPVLLDHESPEQRHGCRRASPYRWRSSHRQRGSSVTTETTTSMQTATAATGGQTSHAETTAAAISSTTKATVT